MHLYFLARGPFVFQEQWEASMRSQAFRWPRKDLKDGKVKEHYVLGNLKPLTLYEYVIPDGEGVGEILKSLNIPSEGKNQGHDNYGLWKYCAKLFRSVLKLDKVPKYDEATTKIRLIPRDGVTIYCLGSKKDETNKTFGYEQEGL